MLKDEADRIPYAGVNQFKFKGIISAFVQGTPIHRYKNIYFFEIVIFGREKNLATINMPWFHLLIHNLNRVHGGNCGGFGSQTAFA